MAFRSLDRSDLLGGVSVIRITSYNVCYTKLLRNPVTCAGHADIIQTKEGDWWAVFLACRPINNKFENLGRETFLMPVKWSEDGFPYMTQDDELVPLT